MPSVNITLTRDALAPGLLRSVVRELIDEFLDCHGGARTREVRSLTVSARVVEIDADKYFICGDVAEKPRYEIEFVTFPNVLDAPTKQRLAERATEIVRRADSFPSIEEDDRIWCFFREIADGDWASGGVIYTSRDVVRWLARRSQTNRRRKEPAAAEVEIQSSRAALEAPV